MSEEIGIGEIFRETEDRMNKSLHVFDAELSKIRTGRASTSLVEHIAVDYYGTQTPINQLATISTPEARTILIQPWDINAISGIEKAIMKSELGVNPANDGKVIRIAIPVLTEERRKDLVKHVHKLAEEYRVAVRQIRKDMNSKLKDAEKEKHVPEDAQKKNLNKIQEITDKSIQKINERLEKKEKEILEV
jgi:ribosome recycling factor